MSKKSTKKDPRIVTEKAIHFIKNKKISIIEMLPTKMTALVEGYHSSDPDYDPDADEKLPYTVIIRNNGEHACSCENFIYISKKNRYVQFWGEDPIRCPPECSHILSVKMTDAYKKWIIYDKFAAQMRADMKNATEDEIRDAITERIQSIAGRSVQIKSIEKPSYSDIIPDIPANLDDLTIDRKKKRVSLTDTLIDNEKKGE